jgi:DNA-directed RNA polymerase sigma subunit (sigma70/sigma32)
MATLHWRSDEGWPYADSHHELADPVGEPDWDLLSLHARTPTMFDTLEPIEHQVVAARYGLEDREPMSMKQIRRETGLGHDEVRVALGSGLAKLRVALGEQS